MFLENINKSDHPDRCLRKEAGEKMRYAIAGLSMLLGSLSVAAPATAQVSVSVSIPGVSIGIHQPAYPDLVLVPGSPVYYAPQVPANYFFYDGLYWVFQDDNWYVSSWYNGPWDMVEPDDVPLFVLRVPVQYYVRPPVVFHTWIVTAPPRWHYHWGPRWTRYHHGWDHWDRHAIPAPAPLPAYQRHYHGDRYPHREYQRVIRHEHYHYQPRDQIVRRHEQQRAAPRPQVHAPLHERPVQHRAESRQEQRPQRDREAGQRWHRDREEAQRLQRTREDMRQSESRQLVTQQQTQQRPLQQPQQQLQQHGAPAQAQRPQRQDAERQVQAPVPPPVQYSPVQPSPAQQPPVTQASQSRPDIPRPQRAPRERESMQRTEAPQMPPQQRAVVAQERRQERQQERRQEQQRQEQAPRPQQAQGQQGRGDASHPRAGAEQRQGPKPDRGQERGRDRGQGRG
jgi:hypothetical protein